MDSPNSHWSRTEAERKMYNSQLEIRNKVPRKEYRNSVSGNLFIIFSHLWLHIKTSLSICKCTILYFKWFYAYIIQFWKNWMWHLHTLINMFLFYILLSSIWYLHKYMSKYMISMHWASQVTDLHTYTFLTLY